MPGVSVEQMERLIDVLARIHLEIHAFRTELKSELHEVSLSAQRITA